MSLEHKPGLIFRVDPKTQNGVIEINVTQYLTKVLGTRAGYVIAGYNDMLSYEDASDRANGMLLIGIEVATPQLERKFSYLNPDAHFLIRRPNGTYSLAGG